MAISAEGVVGRCEEFPDETIDAAVRAVTEAGNGAAAESAPPLLSAAWTDADGYTFDLAIASSVVQAIADIANAKPSEAIINVNISTQGSVTNTTPGRNAPVNLWRLTPVWAPGSNACKYLKGIVGASGGEWCSISGFDDTPQTLKTDGATIPEGGFTAVRNVQSDPFKVAVTEEDAEVVVAELEAPAGFILSVRFLQDKSGCMADGMYVVGATVEVTC